MTDAPKPLTAQERLAPPRTTATAAMDEAKARVIVPPVSEE